MRFKTLALLAIAGLVISAPIAAAAQMPCCDNEKTMSCAKADCDMPCCKHETAVDAIGVLLAMDPAVATAVAPAKQLTEVWFQRPVIVGRHILQGRYVIEHDNDRMARGEPCTHIYAYSDRTKPVVTFHCTHLVREPATSNLVVLYSTSDTMQKMLEFQFEGETASHGVPSVR